MNGGWRSGGRVSVSHENDRTTVNIYSTKMSEFANLSQCQEKYQPLRFHILRRFFHKENFSILYFLNLLAFLLHSTPMYSVSIFRFRFAKLINGNRSKNVRVVLS